MKTLSFPVPCNVVEIFEIKEDSSCKLFIDMISFLFVCPLIFTIPGCPAK